MRNLGEIATIGGRRSGDHICLSFTAGDNYGRLVSAYFAEGLLCGERLVFSGPAASQDDLLIELELRGLEPARRLSDRSLMVDAPEDTYLADGGFDPDATIALWRQMVQDALDDGFSGLRVAADASVLLLDERSADVLPGYELRADLLAATMPFTAVCAYDVSASPEAVALLRAVHPLGMSTDRTVRLRGFQVYGGGMGDIQVTGEIDLMHARTLQQILVEGAKEAAVPQLDVACLRFADLHGVRAIAEGVRALDRRYGEVTIAGARPAFAKVWGMLGYGGLAAVEVRA